MKVKRYHYDGSEFIEREVDDPSIPEPNPNWREARDGECVGAGFDERGYFEEFYSKPTKTVNRVYKPFPAT